ncbi:MAG: 4-alpha-glucanotransferase [Opitutales bacterium]|jgi:4-alpha-glucanotransferase
MARNVLRIQAVSAITAMNTPLFNWLDKRAAGILLHPTSLPGSQGIGTLGPELRRFLDFLKQSGIACWQMLPPGPTGYGDSPYSSFSSKAGNPYLIDLEVLVEFGLLHGDDLDEVSRLSSERVDFGQLYRVKWPILKLAYRRFAQTRKDAIPGYGSFKRFKADKSSWLDSFAVFMALKASHGGRPWYEWEAELQSWTRVRVGKLPKDVREDAEAQRFYQYLFFGQWNEVRKWAAESGVSIIGDMPFYVSRDSADVWAEPEFFDLDANFRPNAVAGVPPDYFSPDGQLWGNPLFNWERLRESGYKWWMDRLEANFEIFDMVRIDHFRAFHNYWRVPADALNARTGEWVLGPGLDFFRAVLDRFPACRLVAEDLGEIDDGVHKLLDGTGLPGMAVLHFAFDGDPANLHLPHNLKANQILYPGTHDNDTTSGWYAELAGIYQDQLRRYLRVSGQDIAWDFIRESYQSVANLTVISVQDILSLGTEARMNEPGTSMGNWQWRMSHVQFEQLMVHAAALKELGWLYGRLPHKKKQEQAQEQ